MDQNSFHLIEQATEMSKITLSVIVYAPCLSKTIIKTNKKQMNSSADTFFLNDPLHRNKINPNEFVHLSKAVQAT